MKAVVQRTAGAAVRVEGAECGRIRKGLLILFGAEEGDNDSDFDYVLKKCVNLRIFSDSEGKMNLSVKDVGGQILCVSQFTLLGEIKKGNRPSFVRAMEPKEAEKLYDRFCDRCEEELGVKTERGVFGADMKVELVNDGPVTIIIDSRNRI